MGSVNKVILVGNLGRDAELRYTPGGAAVTTANMATTEVWTDRNGQRQERTEWMRVTIWGKQAESLQEYLTKGKQIYVEGRRQAAWTKRRWSRLPTTTYRSNQSRALPLTSRQSPRLVRPSVFLARSARLARYAVAQRVQNSRVWPHNGLKVCELRFGDS